MRDSSNIAFPSSTNNVGDHQQERSMSDHDENEPSCTFQKSTSTIETSPEDHNVHKQQQQQHIDEMERGRCHHTWKAFVFIVLVLGGLVGAWVIVFYQPVQAAASLPTTTFTPNNDNGDTYNPVLHDLPTPVECAAISRGETLPGQRNMLVEFFDVEVDVSYEGVTSIGALLPSLETTLKERLAPTLSGCSNYSIGFNNRNLRASNKMWNHAVIANTFLELQDRPGMSCEADSPRSCRRVSLSLQVFLKKDIADSTLRQMILNLGQSNLLEQLNLQAPYTAIYFVDVTPGTPMELTWNPTMAPTANAP